MSTMGGGGRHGKHNHKHKTGWFTIIGTVRECSSNQMAFKQKLEQVTSTQQGVWRKGIPRNERSDTKELHAIVSKGSTIYQTPITMHRYFPVSPEQFVLYAINC